MLSPSETEEESENAIRCTLLEGGSISCLFPDGTERTIGQDVVARSKLFEELVHVTEVGGWFEIPVGEGVPWLTCVQMQATELQHVEDTKLVVYLKVRALPFYFLALPSRWEVLI